MEAGGEGKKEETLPPGFRFHPTDEELITYYLLSKIADANFTGRAIGDVDLNKCEPWDLPAKAKMGEKEWYFFSLRDRKYPTGVRTNRATNTGYWKTTGKDKEIFNSVTSELVGMKKTLVFYRGRAPRGEKTNWVMHEYRIHSKSAFRTTKQDEWVVCRVFQKSAGGKKYPSTHSRAAVVVNPYNLEIGPSHVMQSQMMQQAAEACQFPAARNYMMSNAELAEMSRVFRGGSTSMNFPIQASQLSFPGGGGGGGGGGGAGGGCFTISGLNLNLGGGGGGGSVRAQLVPPHPPPPHVNVMNHHHHHDVSSAMFNASSSAIASDQAVYGADQVNLNANHVAGNRFMTMDPCVEMDNYWPPY